MDPLQLPYYLISYCWLKTGRCAYYYEMYIVGELKNCKYTSVLINILLLLKPTFAAHSPHHDRAIAGLEALGHVA